MQPTAKQHKSPQKVTKKHQKTIKAIKNKAKKK
jgi:hypothetical protein